MFTFCKKANTVIKYKLDMIKAGGVIYNQETDEVALVRMLDGQVCFVSAMMSRNGDVTVEDVGMRLSDCRPATAEEKVALQRAMNSKHLVWDSYRRHIQESKFVPKNGDYVRVSILGEDIISGVFKGVDDNGNIVMYCQLRKDGALGYSQYEVIGPKENYQFQAIGSHARLSLIDALAKDGLVWNNRRRCLEYMDEDNTEVVGHRRYFYINECMEIHEVQDAGKERDRKRIIAGNYFTTREKAEAVRQCFLTVLRLESKAVAPSVRKNKK